ncbi:MAG TPA: sigma-70 family RNA polymerase sigma factor [Candidatus Dormibacteraeota bacterium]
MRAFKQQGSDAPDEEPQDEHARMDAVRSWLANGNHIFGVDPRRRHGHHGHARQLLAEDLRADKATSGEWQALASALDRHTVRGGMAELSAEERQVITLAYLEGRTNREIAAMLGVSVSTVRRRLWVALKRLEAYIGRTRSWVSAVLVLGAGYVVERTSKLAHSLDADWTHKVASTVAVGAVAVAAIGLTAMSPDSTRPHATTAPAAAALVSRAGVGDRVLPADMSNVRPVPVQVARVVIPDISHSAIPTAEVIPLVHITQSKPADGDGSLPGQGCLGNPTSAPPPVPVGSHANHPTGPPVTHPTAGGCRA